MLSIIYSTYTGYITYYIEAKPNSPTDWPGTTERYHSETWLSGPWRSLRQVLYNFHWVRDPDPYITFFVHFYSIPYKLEMFKWFLRLSFWTSREPISIQWFRWSQDDGSRSQGRVGEKLACEACKAFSLVFNVYCICKINR